MLLDGLPSLKHLVEDPRRNGNVNQVAAWRKDVIEILPSTEEYFDAALAAFYEQKNELAYGSRVRDIIRRNHANNRSWRPIQKLDGYSDVQNLYIPYTISQDLQILPTDIPVEALVDKLEEGHSKYLAGAEAFFKSWVAKR